MNPTTNTEQKAAPVSARNAFLLGVGTTAIAGALVIMAFRYDSAKPVEQPSAPVAVQAQAQAPVPEAFQVADHVAAMSETQAQPPAADSSPMPASHASQTTLLSGTIELDPSSATSISGPVTVFVIARDKKGKGHPILAKRLDVSSFPATFSLSAGDAMMGGTPPADVSLEARIDTDRDAMTREPNAPEAKIESIAIGSKGVTLKMKRGM